MPPDSQPPAATDMQPADDPFRLWLDDEWAARPSPPMLVDGLMNVGDVALLVGPPGAGKTFVALELAYRIAGGEPCFGRATERGPVVYLLSEGGHGFKKRIRAWRAANRGHGQRIHVLPRTVNLFDPTRRGEQPMPGDARALMQRLDQLPEPPRLIVVDTLARSALGAEENSSRDMGLVVAVIDQLRGKYGSTVLVLHHETKHGAKGPRGSSALLGATDVCIGVERANDCVRLRSLKSKDLPEFEAFYVRLRSVELDTGETSCVLAAGSAADFTQAQQEDRASADGRPQTRVREARMVVALFQLGPLSGRRVSDAIGVSPSTGANVVKRLAVQGMVIPDDGRYDLAPDVLKQLSESINARIEVRTPSGKPFVIEETDWAAVELSP